MTSTRLLLLAGLLASTAACSTAPVATRQTPLDVPGAQATHITPSFDVTEVSVTAPQSMRVSEANVYYPLKDLVWRGDPIGDRHQQVEDLFNEAIQRSISDLDGLQKVKLDITLARFHAVTEKARYSVGGVHNIVFDMTVISAQTGDVIVPARRVETDLDALGGRAAIAADAAGQTQKVRIIDHLTKVISAELARPIPVIPSDALALAQAQ